MGKRRLSRVLETENGEKDVTDSEVVGSDDEDDQPIEVKPIGDVIKRSTKGKSERKHYEAMEHEGIRYNLEDAVLIAPEQRGDKPYVAIIKEIKQSKDGSIAVTGQWFYRPEEAEKKGGGSWTASDARELFYSFHRDEVPGESVMHKCVVHFIPPKKQPPLRTKHPGFVIRHVYDTVAKTLWKLTDKDYEDSKQQEIDQLIQKTKQALGDLPDAEEGEPAPITDVEPDKIKRPARKKIVSPLLISRDDTNDPAEKGDSQLGSRTSTPASGRTPTPGGGFQSDITDLLRSHKALTGQSSRDRWIEKIVGTLKIVLAAEGSKITEERVDSNPDSNPAVGDGDGLGKGSTEMGSAVIDATETNIATCHLLSEISSTHVRIETNNHQSLLGTNYQRFCSRCYRGNCSWWSESAISAVSALEKVAYEFHGADVHKYNLKMRQLDFNLKKSTVLTRRLLTKDLEPSTVFHMTPVELKDGYTAAETKAREPPEVETLQMTDARCGICNEKEVGVKDIIHTGYGDKYQLECLKCGNSWYAARDFVSTLTTGGQVVNASPTVGLAPWATSKFEEVEKDLVSPKEPAKSPAGAEGNISPLESKSTASREPTVPESHYEEVEKILSEPIPLSGTVLETSTKKRVEELPEEQEKLENETSKEEQTRIGEDMLQAERSKADEDVPQVRQDMVGEDLPQIDQDKVDEEMPQVRQSTVDEKEPQVELNVVDEKMLQLEQEMVDEKLSVVEQVKALQQEK